jgi:hypothetical protein
MKNYAIALQVELKCEKSLLKEFLKMRKSACLTRGSVTSLSVDGVQHSSPPLSSSSVEEEKLVSVRMQRNNSVGNKSMVINAPAVKSSQNDNLAFLQIKLLEQNFVVHPTFLL